MKNYEFKSTEEDMKHFMQSAVFADFDYLCGMRMQAVQNDMVGADSLEKLKHLQGEYNGVAYWRLLPRTLLESMQEEEKQQGEK